MTEKGRKFFDWRGWEACFTAEALIRRESGNANSEIQESHSLHVMFARAFRTVPKHKVKEWQENKVIAFGYGSFSFGFEPS